MRAIIWLIGCVWEVLQWAVLIAIVGMWFGFFAYVGWDTARTLLPFLLGIVHPQ